MYLPEEFQRHAAECQEMAKSTRDPASRATWNEMADRWLRCAQSASAHPISKPFAGKHRPRKVAPTWSHAGLR
jgi:hypothetical protein